MKRFYGPEVRGKSRPSLMGPWHSLIRHSFYLRPGHEKFTGIIEFLQVNQGSANAMRELFLQRIGVFPGYLRCLQMLILGRFIADTIVESGDAVICALTSRGQQRDRDEHCIAFHWLPSETIAKDLPRKTQSAQYARN